MEENTSKPSGPVLSATESKTPDKKKGRAWLYYLTGFFSGMSVMAIELGASRLLAPYFSASNIVWTIVIGTIMIAMALGNLLGGKMADKKTSADALFIWLVAAATWTMLIPLCGKFVISGIALGLATFITKGYLIWAALISCIVVFVFPLLVLGMVTPNIVKFAVKDLSNNGKIVGKIEAFNTIGSIIGTFIPTFVTIPYIGTSWTFVTFAIILYVICLVYFVLRFMKKRIIQTSVIFLVALTAGVVSSAKINVAYWDKTILYEGESTYNYLRVEEESDRYILSTNVLFGVQSVKMKNKGLTGMYYDYALASPVMSGAEEKPLSVLILGLGTGTFASLCYDYFNSVSVDGVEIDGKIVDLAREYFALPDAVNVAVEDGRAFLNMSKSKYDVIMVDAYRDITIPFQMSTVEFFTSVQEHLSARGTMILNMNMYSDLDGGIDDYMVGTIASVFSSVYTVVTGGTNIELYASSVFDCKAQLDSQLSLISGHSDLSSMMSQVSANMVKRTANGYILTDDKAPVEKLGMDVLDDYVADELAYYQRKLRGMSLKEIWDSLMNGSFF